MNLIRLTEDLIRNGKTYPKGTECRMIGMLSPHDIYNNGPMALGLRLENEEFVEVTKDIRSCTDFKYEPVKEKV